ncbi:hypothetical protein [Pseudomonas cichorii]|uniref:hypothetical protein n=1 Tax=Pseudomonas cichorii TaxID=36746 RepID=UPI001C89E238|nr:hypothetical protein [Pseudomonas cichorii]MBX8497800.1 hypothetical protein [Pseudomonas cichorii]
MRKVKIAALVFATLPASAFAESIFLNCQQISGSGFNIPDAYKVAPKNPREQFIQDALEQGIIGLFIEPPKTWEVNLTDKTIISPEESHKVFAVTSDSGNKIEGASKFSALFSLNRINGILDYSLQINENARKTWHASHGGNIPAVLSYKLKCQSQDKPAI